jgi:hypothetical protein
LLAFIFSVVGILMLLAVPFLVINNLGFLVVVLQLGMSVTGIILGVVGIMKDDVKWWGIVGVILGALMILYWISPSLFFS